MKDFDITYRSIGEIDRMLLRKKDTEQKKAALMNVMDKTVFSQMGDGMVEAVYEAMSISVEDKIRKLIEENTGEIPVDVGTEIILKYDMGESCPKGSRAVIVDVMRFEEDTFGQGWYRYTTDSGAILCRNEFELSDND